MQVKYQAKLRGEMVDNGINQRKFARMVGVHESIVSRVINGKWALTPTEKRIWAAHLGKHVEEVFDN